MENFVIEFLGTFALLLSIVLSRGNPLVIGGTLALAILLGGKISGGHFNPAVSTAFLLNKKMKLNAYIPYIAAQLLGATVAVMLSPKIRKAINKL